jgi:hypothetical protein
MPLEFRAVTGEGSEVRMALHLTSLHKQPSIALVEMLPDQVDPMATCHRQHVCVEPSGSGTVGEVLYGKTRTRFLNSLEE